MQFLPAYDALIQGYERVRPLPDGLDRHLQPLVALRQLQLALWFLEMRDHPAFGDWQEEVQDLLAELKEPSWI